MSTRTFTTARRGYQPDEVRQFLTRVADELAAAAARESELRRALQEALSRAAHPALDEQTLTAGLGEHAGRLIASAREAATAIVADAEKRAATLLHDAEVRSGRLRDESEGLMARRVEEAEAAGASIRQAAEAEVRAARERARIDAEATLADAQAKGKEMVGEARAVRERMLSDLSRRRRAAQVQIDQLRAGRQRLLEAYEVVRRTLEDATRELDAADVEARVAAEEAGRRAVESDIAVRPEPAAPTAVTVAAAPADRSPTPPTIAGVPSPDAPPPAPDASPAPAPAPAPVGARAIAVARPTPLQRRPEDSGRTVATLAPPRPPALRPQSVAEAAPVRARLAAVAAPPEPRPSPVAEPAAEPQKGKVEDLFARLRQEVLPPATDEASIADPHPAPAAAVAPRPAAVEVTDENALARRDEILEPVESELTRALKRVLQDEHNEVLDRLRRTRSSAADAVLADHEAQVARYQAAATPFLDRAAVAGARGAGCDDGRSAARGLAEALARELVEPLRSRLEQALDHGTDDEGGLFESISSIYRQWKVQQIEPLARHAAATAFTRGRFDATPDGTALRWLVDDDGGRCPDCDDNALAGPVAKGEGFPTGQTHPPAHPGCRCLLVATVP